MVTPRPKAVAVRRGVSWMWSSRSIQRSRAFFVRCHIASEVDETRRQGFPAAATVEPGARFFRQLPDPRDGEATPATGRAEKGAGPAARHREEEFVVFS